MGSSPDAAQTRSGPKFDNPPVVETALGIQFVELPGFNTTHFGLFHEEICDRYAVAVDQPRLDRIIETFPKAVRTPHFKLRTAPRPERVWFKDSPDGSRLVQLQPDRFGFNWRKPDEETQYPSYSVNSQLCLAEFRVFTEFCERQGWPVKPDLCEVVYVNQIWPVQGESVIDLFANIFTGIGWGTSDDWLPSPEVVTLNRVFEIPEQRGRLYAEAGLAIDKDEGPFINLRMLGRALHTSGNPSDIEDTLRLAHDWVVNGFVSLTDRTTRQERWGQRI